MIDAVNLPTPPPRYTAAKKSLLQERGGDSRAYTRAARPMWCATIEREAGMPPVP
jgi:hypothetical protein